MRHFHPRLRGLPCVAALLLSLTACAPEVAPAPSPPLAGARTLARVVAASPGNAVPSARIATPRAGVAAPINRATAEFRAFALNALLVPLLDDEVPERWADPSLSLDCDNADVTVDGERLDIGSPVGEAFTLRWWLDRCYPLGADVELTGEVELQVQRCGGHYVAKVRPSGLQVASSAGIDVLLGDFDAALTNSPNLPR